MGPPLNVLYVPKPKRTEKRPGKPTVYRYTVKAYESDKRLKEKT